MSGKENLFRKSIIWILVTLLFIAVGCFTLDYLISQIRPPTANIFKSTIRKKHDSQGQITSIICPFTQYPTYDIECEVRERFLHQINELGELKHLRIDGGLTKFPTAVLQLKKLEHLSLSIDTSYTDSSYTMSIPPEIGRVTSLRSLSLSEVESIPPEIAQLKNLEELHIRGNLTIPSEIWTMTNLQSLILVNPSLSAIPPEIGQLEKLEQLYISGDFATIPPEIWTLSNLKKLLIAGNLTELPSEIENLTRLEELSLPENNLNTLPPEVYHLTNLQVLHLQKNNLTALPPEIGQLTNIYDLDLSSNNLSTLPPEIGKLNNLKQLRLGGNPITPSPFSSYNNREKVVEYLQNFVK